MEPLRGRTALLTGATGGIGRATARALAAEGVHLALGARDARALEQLSGQLRGLGVRAEPLAVDLRDPAAVDGLAERARAAIGPLDLLVNNAGIEVAAGFEQLTAEELDEIVRVNVSAPLRLTRAVVPGMLERAGGHVVLLSSVAALTGTAYNAVYAATKGALLALAHSLRAEYADRPLGDLRRAARPRRRRGQFARAQADSIRFPRALMATPEGVARGIVRAVRADAPEVLVSPGPIRAGLALGVLAPRTTERVIERLGLAQLFRPAARAHGRA